MYPDFANSKVWYAVYGSNLNHDRFTCYIKGGVPDGASIKDQGCHDSTQVIDGGKILLPYELYFAKESYKWGNKAVAFICFNKDASAITLGRKYLVTEEQFNHIFKQENCIDIDNSVDIDLVKSRKQGSFVVRKAWYGCIVYIGEESGFPIFTLTAYWDIDAEVKMAPSFEYLRHVIKGIKQAYDLNDAQIADYLITKPGLSTNFSRQELMSIIGCEI